MRLYRGSEMDGNIKYRQRTQCLSCLPTEMPKEL